ncbi:MAG TPA: VOC family protein [Candidatus Limnocylindria bacterium]|nr:VOC family protein [Candidatus Limnocylindria bacterium]
MHGDEPASRADVEQLVVVITTAAFDASLAFYRDVIGLEVVEEWTDAGHGATLSAGGPARVELIDLPERAQRVNTDSLFIGLQVSAIEGIHERAAAAGVEIVREPADRPWGGRGLVIRDPNGVALNVYTAYDAGPALS